MRCPNCGKEVDANHSFCAICGFVLRTSGDGPESVIQNEVVDKWDKCVLTIETPIRPLTTAIFKIDDLYVEGITGKEYRFELARGKHRVYVEFKGDYAPYEGTIEIMNDAAYKAVAREDTSKLMGLKPRVVLHKSGEEGPAQGSDRVHRVKIDTVTPMESDPVKVTVTIGDQSSTGESGHLFIFEVPEGTHKVTVSYGRRCVDFEDLLHVDSDKSLTAEAVTDKSKGFRPRIMLR